MGGAVFGTVRGVGALVVLAAEAGSITPGGTGECVVLIRNEAETHDDFDVLVHGPAAVWATVDPPIASVPPGEEVPVWVRFAIPRERAIPPGPIDFVVTVASKSDPDFIHAERGAITIGGFAVLAAALDEPHGEGKTFLVPVTLTNEGNASIEANVGVRDSYEPPLKVQVAPGGSTSLDVEVPRRPGLEKVTIDITAAGVPALAFTAPVPDQHRTLRRDLVRSAMAFGGLLLAAFIVVATLGRDDEPETA